jgi:superfamily II DNA or RNA helicase
MNLFGEDFKNLALGSDVTRDGRQKQGIEKWKQASFKGTLHWATGVGKTNATVRYCILPLISQVESCHIIVPEPVDELRKQWVKALKEYAIPTDKVHIFSIHECVNQGIIPAADIIIIDELHDFYKDTRASLVRAVVFKAKYALGLTATPYDREREASLKYILPIVDVISEEEAITNGWISQYEEFNIGLELPTHERIRYDELSTGIGKLIAKFSGIQGVAPLDVANSILTGKGSHSALDIATTFAESKGWHQGCNKETDAMWNPRMVIGYARNLMLKIRERKDFVYNHPSKVIVAKQIIDKYPTLKCIVFAQSSQFADELTDAVNNGATDILTSKAISYHSNLETRMLPIGKGGALKKAGKKTLKDLVVARIRSGDASVISTVRAFDKGLDIQDIRLCIVASSTQSPIQYQQRKGRSIRIDMFNKEHRTLVVNLYMKDTVDEKWLVKKQGQSTNQINWIDKIEQINFNQ